MRGFRIYMVLFLVMIIPFALVVANLSTPNQFDETYYGELRDMYYQLRDVQGQKIVIVGTSSVAFGVDATLLTQELNVCGLDYTVCNFGLYGALGIKVMLDLSIPFIHAGDIVIISPELNNQVMSLYFSGADTWRAIEDDISLFMGVKDKGCLMGSYPGFVAEKISFSHGSKLTGSGVYTHSAFDEKCVMRYEDRKNNIMPRGYDEDTPILFSNDLLTDTFISYINTYNDLVRKRGGEVWYSFAPMNECAVLSEDREIEAFCDELANKIKFEILGDPYASIYEKEWFYDSNYHLNQEGMICRTLQLSNEIKTKLGITQENLKALPDMPDMPETVVQEETADDSDCFAFETRDEGVAVVGLTEKGKKATALRIPGNYEGRPIVLIEQAVFSKNEVLESVVISKELRILNDGIFRGCRRLKQIILEQEDPRKISVGQGLLDGAENCVICVPANSLGDFQIDYFWSHYVGKLVSGGGKTNET